MITLTCLAAAPIGLALIIGIALARIEDAERYDPHDLDDREYHRRYVRGLRRPGE